MIDQFADDPVCRLKTKDEISQDLMDRLEYLRSCECAAEEAYKAALASIRKQRVEIYKELEELQ